MYIIPEFNNTRSRNNRVETYRGRIKTLRDALLVLEGSRVGVLPQIKRRLNSFERQSIKPNTIFAWNQTECGMKRWTDGKNWSASKVAGPFLIYRELDQDKKVKKLGLTKQSFSLTTKQGAKLHLISYYLTENSPAKEEDETCDLGPTEIPTTSAKKAAAKQYPDTQPSKDPLLSGLTLDSSIYQEYLLYYDQYSSTNSSEAGEKKSSRQPTPKLNNVFTTVPEQASTRPPLIAHKTNSYPQAIQQVQQTMQFQQSLQQHTFSAQPIHAVPIAHFHRQQSAPNSSNQKVPSISAPGTHNYPSPQPSHLLSRTSLVPPILYQPLIYPPPPPVTNATTSSTPSSSTQSSSYFQPTPSDSHTVPAPAPSSFTISTGYYNYAAQHSLPQYYHPPSGAALLAGVYHYPLEAPRIYHSNAPQIPHGPPTTMNSANVSEGSSPSQSVTQYPKKEDSKTIKMLDKSFSFK